MVNSPESNLNNPSQPEKEQKPAEKFIGDTPFAITAESVTEYLEKYRTELSSIETELPDESNDRLKEFMVKRKAGIEKILEVSPDEILRLLQEVYNFVRQKEAQGIIADDIVKDMDGNKPDLAETVKKFYGILRDQTWGYLLGQHLLAFRAFNK